MTVIGGPFLGDPLSDADVPFCTAKTVSTTLIAASAFSILGR
jgi:hypothetical protein